MAESDPIEQAAAALQHAIGSDENELRARMGNAGYETFLRRSNAVADLHVLDSKAHLDQSRANVRYVETKAVFWATVAFGMVMASLLGAGWSIWEWVH